MENQVKTLADAIRYFADEQVCIDIVAGMRWLNGPECPKCDAKADRQHWLKVQRRWQCRDCAKQYSVKVNTIFEDSALSLDKWLTAMWLLANCKNGISSYEVAKDIGVTQKSAWFMLQRIRYAMENKSVLKMGADGGPVEVDEAYIGGSPANKHISERMDGKYIKDSAGCTIRNSLYKPTTGRATKKTPVMGMLDRDTRQVRAQVIPEIKREVLMNAILNNIEKKSTIYTDGLTEYQGLKAMDFVHDSVNHLYEYVRGEVHTNGIENFWSLLKRGLRGTYVAVEPFHLDRYVTEQVFRFNNRSTKDNPLTDADRFALVVSQVSGKRLTYAELTGKVGDPQVN
jgi:transposase-like protein